MTACCGVTACGALLGFEALKALQSMKEIVGPAAGDWISTLFAAAGALLAILMLRDRFGEAGCTGAARAVLGALATTIVLGIIAGTLTLPVYGTMFGPWLVLTVTISKPWLAMTWALSLYGVHLAMAEYKFERDSIHRWIERANTT